jgi:hypothetical protein
VAVPLAIDVESSGTGGDATLIAVGLVSVAMLLVVDAGSCAGVEVDETNGGAFWTYEPSGWTAYSPTST